MTRNRLADATSPYLRQHAGNPVEWHPWAPAALALARELDRPILLSIGYSACHWCHVMAHESFEDAATAELMNGLFVNIKVDREERPDLDRIYQAAHQLLTRRAGGWPLTMFLTPDDLTPFFGGTYFPSEPRHGLPAFREVLEAVAAAYRQNQASIRQQNQSLIQSLSGQNPTPRKGANLHRTPLTSAVRGLLQNFDHEFGGFGAAPKFPQVEALRLLLHRWAETRTRGTVDDAALRAVEASLTRMALGGINDQLGGGFCRYSVDRQWMIPHFEKMLYDNGPLLGLYADLWQATGEPLYRLTAERTVEWVLAEMRAPAGGFFSALDADSEGEEGRFYLWTPEEVRSLLTPEEYAVFAPYYGLDGEPNFEGRWHLHSQAGGLPAEADRERMESARAKLLARRNERVRPGCDDKILTAWNALTIRNLAHAGRLLGRDDYLQAAARALEFIRENLWRDGRLLAVYKDGVSHLPAYLDDHAFLLDALLELLQARWDGGWMSFAVELAELLLNRFEDKESGGFFFTADDHESLIHRPKPFNDEAMASGNGTAAVALGRLGLLLGEPRYLSAGERTLLAAIAPLEYAPHAHCTLLGALRDQLDPPELIILRGPESDMAAWKSAALARYQPHRLLFAIPAEAVDLPPALAAKAPVAGVIAYLCRGLRCDAPITDLEQFRERLG